MGELAKRFNNKKHFYILLRVLAVIAIVFFVNAIIVNMRNSFWRDEAFTSLLVEKDSVEIIKIMSADNNPPFHPLLLHFLTLIFPNNEIVLRSVSILSILAVGLLLRFSIKNKYIKEFATILFFTSYHSYFFATEARYYALFMFTVFCSFLTTRYLAKDPSRKNLILFTIANTLMLYTHTLGIFMFFANFLIYLYLLKKNNDLNRSSFWKSILYFGITGILYIPWIFAILSQLDNLGKNGFWLTFSPLSDLANYSSAFFYNDWWNVKNIGFFNELGLILYILSTLIGIFYLIRNKKDLYLIALFVPFWVIYLVSFKQPLFYIRYIIFLLPFLMYVTAYGLKKYYKSFGLLAVILIFLFNLSIFEKSFSTDYKPPSRQISNFVKKNTTEEHFIINDNEYSYFECEHYLGDCYILKNYDDINKSIGLSLIPREKVIDESKADDYSKIVIIYYNDDKPHFEFLKDYKEVNEVHLETQSDKLNASIYEKL